ncbi:pentatricopeptide repeat-containing protein At5g66520-like [Phalaenopsis equestris]|uniref:pentatricopeptide repeat-containing protein At5g66520-like n=1 Tax=Phalaenopsis equestris TaxID=78828 RepID=UPI0009E3C630|nr:pentatricopeptide repeat-containing protein At5g66520-like [Phalaenopsis equestris]
MPKRHPAPATSLAATSLAGLFGQCRSPRKLHQIHTQIVTSPLFNRRIAASLISRLLFFCSTFPSPASLAYGSILFHSILSPTLFNYNAIIRIQSSSFSFSISPLFLYNQMLGGSIRPDHLTFPFLLKFCSLRLDGNAGQALHAHVVKLGFQLDVFIQNSMIIMYSSCGLLVCAEKVFDEMPRKDVVSKNSILTGYLNCGEMDAALDMFSRMEERNLRTWNSVIAGLVHVGRAREALGLFQEMLLYDGESVKPDNITIASVITACASIGALDQGKWLHSYLRRKKMDFDVVIGTALIDMYGKCGSLTKAREVFEEILEKDVLAWTAMISVLAVHGRGEEALVLFEKMVSLGLKPNYVTFGSLLSACAHSGLVEKGRWCFDLMKRVYLIKPQVQHFACMVDLLGRAGLFSEAETLIRSMPMEPDSFVWGALLGACRMHGNVELGERIAGYFMQRDPLNHAFYMVLSDIYAKAKRFEDVKKIWNFMKEMGIKKTSPGCSMIDVDGQLRV